MKLKFRPAIFCIALSLLHRFFLLRKVENKKLTNSLLLIAHPDDESMFFSPFLYWSKPFILCLSDGNFDGKGKIRRQELINLCKDRKLNYKILNYIDNSVWDVDLILYDLVVACKENRIKQIVTFDSKGVSGHKNHISCFKAAKKLEKLDINKLLRFKYLKSVSLFEKYFAFIRSPNYNLPIFSTFGYGNMNFHKSQLVWFRYIYIIFSNYMKYNIII